jgi:hypothetical protein
MTEDRYVSKTTKTKRQAVSILGFSPPTEKEQERAAAEHLVDVKTRNHPTVKKIRNAILDEVLQAGVKVTGKARRG